MVLDSTHELFNKIREDQKQTYVSAANISGLTRAGFVSAEIKTKLIVERVEQQPNAKVFLTGAFKLRPVHNYMTGMNLTPEAFIDYIQANFKTKNKKTLTSEQKLTYGIEVLPISIDSYERLIRQNMTRIYDILSNTNRQLNTMWGLGPHRPRIIKEATEKWCLENGLVFEDYPLGKRFVVIEPLLQESLKYPSNDPLTNVDLTESVQRKLAENGYVTINDIANVRKSDISKIDGISDRVAGILITSINDYVIHQNEFDENSIHNHVKFMGIRTRGIHSLIRAGFPTIYHLYNMPRYKLASVRNLGNKTAEHVIEKAIEWAELHDIDQSIYPFFTELEEEDE